MMPPATAAAIAEVENTIYGVAPPPNPTGVWKNQVKETLLNNYLSN